MVERKLRVGLIGLGGISYAHEAGYAELGDICEIIAMCDINGEEVNARKGMYAAKGYTDYKELLSDPDVDLVDITTPHDSHYEISMAAIAKGKHVLVEKPIAVTSAKGAEMVRAAKMAKVKFSVAENTRFVTAYLEAEKLMKEGLTGDLYTVRSMIAGSEVHRIKDPNLWHGKAPYGGVILDSAVHNFYLYKWLFGGVKDVMGFASKLVSEGEMEDNGLIIGHLANGAEFQLFTTCTGEIPWTERVEIYGKNAGIIIDQLANPVLKYYKGSGDIDGAASEQVPFDPFAWKFNSMMAEVKDFVAAVRDDRPPAVDPMDGVYAVRVVEAVDESIKTRKFVSLG
jgi:predicted dehydrogenase